MAESDGPKNFEALKLKVEKWVSHLELKSRTETFAADMLCILWSHFHHSGRVRPGQMMLGGELSCQTILSYIKNISDAWVQAFK